nr:unnamed protein product [Callosobruchus chinensis]
MVFENCKLQENTVFLDRHYNFGSVINSRR